MLITKFNKLIRNKMLWGIFALVVCFSFVFGSVFRRGGNNQKQGVAGMLFGEEIPNREFFTARFYELGMRERPGLSPEANAKLRDRAWKRIAALNAVEKMGLTVSAAEINDVIQTDSAFHVNGVFNKARYRATVESQLRVGVQTFEDYVRQDILIRKLMQLMQSMVWNSSAEVNRRLDNITDEFKLEVALLPVDRVVGEVKTTVEDAQEYYEQNKTSFMEPEKLSVKYVAFPISNHLASVTVSEEEMSAYYEENQDDYLTSSTNVDAEVLPFDDVRDDIAAMLTRGKAAFMARDMATELVMAMAPGRYTAGLSMEDAAAGRGLNVATTGYFSAWGSVEGLNDVGEDFTRIAFNLEPGSTDAYFSDPIVGLSNVYVIAFNDRRDERLPEFDEVRDSAMQAAQAEAKSVALFNKSEEIRKEIIDGQESFSGAMAKYSVNVSTTDVFTVYDGNEDMELADVIIPEIMGLREGELTEAIPAPGGVALACVAERTPGDIATAQLLRPQLQATLSRYRAGIVYDDWADYLLANADFEDFSAVDDDGGDDEDDQ